ncbi:hypothetical protein CWI36_1747p0010 [Hamiltosporidium magnivora]|uniref:Uncharacterized protein n=1 Tax=Hamiltosporidium magnivora TaxID=148818 RepID=A0A4Q9KYL7_9MICR|nr:hypothetical protein CWI36_1747p0010 [Hamiltosporidium magnivora]
MLNEEKPERNCKSKRFITKIMFMAAVARPRYDAHRKLYFDGKIGIWPFVYQEPAQRNSKNRAKGTMITENVESVTAVHCKNMIIDNSKPYFSDNDANIIALGSAEDWNIKFTAQPVNIPDLNILDLASPHTIDDLINCFHYGIHQLEANTLDNVFTTLQACMESIMLADGGNRQLLEKYVHSKEAYNNAKSNSSELININIYFFKFYNIYINIY